LSKNQFQIEAVMHLAQGLVINKSLEELNLDSNQLSSKGCILLCETIKCLAKLTTLSLKKNRIEDRAASSISAMIQEKTCGLRELRLGGNEFGCCGLTEILSPLARNMGGLKYLDIANNFIDIGLLHPLRVCLEKNAKLKYLSISNLHKFNEGSRRTIVEALIKNETLKVIDVKKITKEFSIELDSINNRRSNELVILKDKKNVIINSNKVPNELRELQDKFKIGSPIENH
jgi:Ran GTPase-activating protein (RanGAP) involved in mRNA processing and transport